MPYFKETPDLVEPVAPKADGPLPALVECSSIQQEISLVRDQAIQAGTRQTVAVLARTWELANTIARHLPRPSVKLDHDMSTWQAGPKIYYGTFHGSKGLEFDTVILPFLTASNLPDSEQVRAFGALGLVALYDVDHHSEWLNAATKALSYLARNPTALSAGPPDHWTLIATAAVLGRCDLNECQHSRQLLLQHAVRICNAIFAERLIYWSSPRVIGQNRRTTAVATRMEGLLSALEFVPETEVALRKQIRENIELGLRLLLRSQIAMGPYAGGIPRSFPGPPDDSVVRIDYVQHSLCVWIQYRKLFGAAREMCCTSSVIRSNNRWGIRYLFTRANRLALIISPTI